MKMPIIEFFGVSVKGPHHHKSKSPNQDYWLGRQTRQGTLIAVCDGLGSRPGSELGSKNACLAVWDSFKLWQKAKNSDANDLIRLVKILWDVRTPAPRDKYATTCLFAAFTPEQRLLVAGLGDGLAVVKHPDNRIEKVIWRETGFSNETISLGTPHHLNDWKCISHDEIDAGTVILLASDGVADDLIEERIPDFLDWLVQTYGSLSPRQRYLELTRLIRGWPTARHQDDKTIAIIIAR